MAMHTKNHKNSYIKAKTVGTHCHRNLVSVPGGGGWRRLSFFFHAKGDGEPGTHLSVHASNTDTPEAQLLAPDQPSLPTVCSTHQRPSY